MVRQHYRAVPLAVGDTINFNATIRTTNGNNQGIQQAWLGSNTDLIGHDKSDRRTPAAVR
jgi:hypothetical protein